MAILGLRGTGAFGTDDRPKNYRQVILLLFPNASAPLTALLSKLKDEPTDDPEFKWFMKPLPPQRTTANGAFTNVAGSIAVAAGTANIFKKGHTVLDELTLELMWVTADPVSPFNTITVARGKGSAAAASSGAADGLVVVGSHYPEGASVPTAITYDPTVANNYTQIFRNSLQLTNTGKQMNLRYADGQYIKEAKREALELHSIEIEKAFLFGGAVEDTSGSQPERSTKGAINFISTNVQDFTGSVSIDGWENFLEKIFQNGSPEKLALVGSRALNVFNKLGRVHGTLQVTPTSTTFGMQFVTWQTPYGVLQIKQHPLLSNNATFQSWGFIFDPARIVYRYLRNRDTQYLENRQSPGDDVTTNEFLSECGLELQFEQAHGIFKNAVAFAP